MNSSNAVLASLYDLLQAACHCSDEIREPVWKDVQNLVHYISLTC